MDTSTSSAQKKMSVYDVLQFAPLLPALPVGAALVHFVTHPRRWSAAGRVGLFAGAAAAVLNVLRWQLQRFVTPKPDYQVLRRIGDLEVRRYPRLTLAQTDVELDFDGSLDEGFDRLASYIFGKNATDQKMPMTAPVTTQHRRDGHTISFVMAPEHAAALPEPKDSRVRLYSQRARTIAALKFTGRYDGESVREATEALLRAVHEAGLERRGEPLFAGYDAPATLPPLRRNEVWVELKR
ncbi:MAG: heme-binding protein [Myxococcaceae bacterium]|nr:heme-binding protein [Myxococcaceae bacterium]